MSQKSVNIPGVGPVLLVKRRGTKNLRLTIQPDGRVRVGMPPWAPYSAAIAFVVARADWINRHLEKHQAVPLANGQLIGKSYRLKFVQKPGAKRVAARIGPNSIVITAHMESSHPAVQDSAAKACERALRREAARLLSQRLQLIAGQHNFRYESLKIKRLRSRWGSCSQDGAITLNYFLVQLPWELIDYVIVHELAHTVHLNHSRDFWEVVEKLQPGAARFRKDIRQYRPVLQPTNNLLQKPG